MVAKLFLLSTFEKDCRGQFHQAAFMCGDPKSEKKLLNLIVFLALLGSERVKAARRMLVKLTPDWTF